MSNYRGFADLPKEQRTELARKGGIAAHKYPGRSWEWTRPEAIEAGRKGGLETWRRRRAAKAAAEQKTEGAA